jgi:hypothetical protein
MHEGITYGRQFGKSRFGSSDYQGHVMDMWDWAMHIKPKTEIPY